METQENLPEKFADAMLDIPVMPGHIYASVTGKIRRKKILLRTVWAAAASVIISISAFGVSRISAGNVSCPLEVTEELSTVGSYFNGDTYQENLASYTYYEETSSQ
jgi:hypothetical protein